MYESGWKLRESREQSGFTQADVAKRLGVSQQTVSRWESVESRPSASNRAKLADLFGVADHDGSFRHLGDQTVGGSRMPRPVRPMEARLPLGSLPWETFEGFCRDFIRLRYPGVKAYRYGEPGQDQDGIDLVAELPDGTRVGYQCRRVRQFGPKKLRDAVDAISFEADRYVLSLSRPASVDLRREALRHPKWEIEDVEDISTIVRNDLSRHDAKRLVDTYFPGWTKDFLGISSPGVWLTADEFFRPLLRPSAAISHGWHLVGRSEELAAIDHFIASDQKCLVLSGRGGIGKTRLLLGVSSRVDVDIPVFFAAPDTRFQPEDMDLLPTGRFIIVVDDAHNRDDIVALFSSLSRYPYHIWKLVVATRPHGKDRLVGDLLHLGLLRLKDNGVVDVEDLEMDDTKALAAEVLSQHGGPSGAARLVAEATRDCPLLTVIAAKLVAAKRLDPRNLGSDEKARSLLIRQFKDMLISDLGERSDRDALMDLLELVALIQPIIPDDEFRTIAASFLDQRSDRVMRGLRILEQAGVLVRRGRKLRVVPDLFGDFLVADACVDPVTGSPTGYAEEVFAEVSGSLAQNVIVSIARLDWRVSRERQWDSTVLDRIWGALTRDLLASSAISRDVTLSSLSEVSYYQPRRALDLSKALLQTPPSPDDPSLGLPRVFSTDPEYRFAGIPKFLRNVAYSLEHVGEACDLLWAIGRNSVGMLQAEPDNAIRILQDIASITSTKPIEYLSAVAGRAITWTQDPDLSSYRHSPLDVLEPLVATDSRDTRMKGLTMQITPFVVDPDAVRTLRDQAMNTAISLLGHPHPRVGVQAARFLGHALRYPSEQFGREPTSDQRSAWTTVFCRELDLLGAFLRHNDVDAIIGEEIRQAIRWHAKHGDETRVSSLSILTSLEDDRLTVRLTQVLAYGWDGYPSIGRPDRDYGEIVAEWRSIQRQVARDLRCEVPDPIAAVSIVEERIRALTLADGLPPSSNESVPAILSAASRLPSSAGPFLSILCNEWEEVAAEILTRVVMPSGVLRPYTGIALSQLWNHQPHSALEISRQLIDTGVPELAASVAGALTGHAHSESPTATEMKMINELLDHDEPDVRLVLARGLRLVSGMDHETRLGLITTIPIKGDLSVAEAIVDNFDQGGDYNIEEAPPQFIPRVLEELVPCEKLDDYTISRFLAEVSKRDPDRVLTLYMSRVDHGRTTESYSPLPYPSQHRPPLQFRQSANFRSAVYRICDWMLNSDEDWHRSLWAPELFALAVGNVDKQVLDHLDHWSGSTDPKRLEVAAHLLSELSGSFVWEMVDWVNDLLERAYALGDSCYDSVSVGLQGAVESGLRRDQPGQPRPAADIEQRDRSRTVASTLPLGSPARRFYKRLATSAELSIEQRRQHYEEMQLQ